MFDQIENLKRDYTDKYVIVDAKQPELKRFRDQVGLVKTVNMSGRALVEFQDYINNIGWFDIDLSFLKVVDKPPPKPPEAKEKPAKPAAEKPAAKAAPAKPSAPAAAPAAPGAKKQSVAEILAAARTKGGAPVAPPAKPAAEKPAPATVPAAKAEPSKKLSTADILAARARQGRRWRTGRARETCPDEERACSASAGRRTDRERTRRFGGSDHGHREKAGRGDGRFAKNNSGENRVLSPRGPRSEIACLKFTANARRARRCFRHSRAGGNPAGCPTAAASA